MEVCETELSKVFEFQFYVLVYEGIAVEVWTTNAAILFDNFLVSASTSAAADYAAKTFKPVGMSAINIAEFLPASMYVFTYIFVLNRKQLRRTRWRRMPSARR